MVRLTGVLNRLDLKKVLVVGDFMVDAYTIGKARRISPEAPVAVVQVQKEEYRPGGAGNVVLNLVSMGAEVITVGRVGNDFYGSFLKDEFSREGIDVSGIFVQPGYCTPVKNRIIADSQQIVRIDHEQVTPLPELLEEEICKKLPQLMEGVQVVAISDYGKGVLSRSLLNTLIDHARALGIPVISDPKGADFAKYAGSYIIKPNLSEAYSAAGLPAEAPLDQVAEKVLQLSQSDILMVTRSEHGISLFYKEGHRQDFPVRIREVKDVTGAGDTVLAMLACALANKLSLPEAVQLSNIAAGIAIERFGCARITLGDLANRLLDFDADNKVFDEGHAFAMKKALESKEYVILNLTGSQGLTSAIFNAIRKLASETSKELVLYVRDEKPAEEFIDILAAIHDVRFIFLSNNGLKALTEYLSPKKIYHLENNILEEMSSLC
jgi:D-beta-D-heptose 7-phosphate kinase/D-beta-D-heptose 1-phosphate adenosyltransferase